MPEYWFVISPKLDDLYEALKSILDGRPGFHVIRDRRLLPGTGPSGERRVGYVWEEDGILIAERDTARDL